MTDRFDELKGPQGWRDCPNVIQSRCTLRAKCECAAIEEHLQAEAEIPDEDLAPHYDGVPKERYR